MKRPHSKTETLTVKIAGCNRLTCQVSKAAFDWLWRRELIKHVQTTKSDYSTWIADGSLTNGKVAG